MPSSEYVVKNVIVTGGTGVTGNALVKYLLREGISVTAIIRPGSVRRSFLPAEQKGFNIIECDLADYPSLKDSLPKNQFDVFFHLAWDGSMGKEKVNNRNNFSLQIKNVEHALGAVELCHAIACDTFIMTGSQAEYGRKDCAVTEDMAKNPENGYGMAKLCAEGMTRLFCQGYGIRHIWPILFSIYGPYDAAESLVDTTLRGLKKGETLPYTKGEQEWDYLYSYDAAKALLLLAKRGRAGEAYNVANGKTRRLADYINDIYEVAAPKKTPRLGELPYGENQVMLLSANIDKLQKTTGFKADYEFKIGIEEIYSNL